MKKTILLGIYACLALLLWTGCEKAGRREQGASPTMSNGLAQTTDSQAPGRTSKMDGVESQKKSVQQRPIDVTGVLRASVHLLNSNGVHVVAGRTNFLVNHGSWYYFLETPETRFINISSISNVVQWKYGNKYRVKGLVTNKSAATDSSKMPVRYDLKALTIEDLGKPPQVIVDDLRNSFTNLMAQNQVTNIQLVSATINTYERDDFMELKIEAQDFSQNPGDGAVKFVSFVSSHLNAISKDFDSVRLASLSAEMKSPDGKPFVAFTLGSRKVFPDLDGDYIK